MEEITYCIKKDLVSKNEQHLYKLLLDYHEATSSSFYKPALRFYKKLTQGEIDNIIKQIEKFTPKDGT